MDRTQVAHNATAHAGWWVAHRLLALLVERRVLTHADAIQILNEGAKASAGGGPVNKATALILEQIKTYHQKAAGLVRH